MTSNAYESPLEDPPLNDWIASIRTVSDSNLQSLRAGARKRIVLAARRFSEHLSNVAAERLGPTPTNVPQLDGSPDERPVIMTGHQPVIFHSGLTYKYETVEQFVRQQNAIGIALVIDTDEGDAGEFACPSMNAAAVPDPAVNNELNPPSHDLELWEMAALGTVRLSVSVAPAMHATSLMKSKDNIRHELSVAVERLKRCQCDNAVMHLSHVAEVYQDLANLPTLEANLIARRRAGIGAGLMEVRLSEVCGFPECVQFFGQLLSRPFKFAQRYNETLDQFRAERKIKNHANPFPNLNSSSDECELPFWIVDLRNGTRTVPVVRRIGGVPTLQTSGGLSVELIPGHEAAAVFSLLFAQTPLIPRGALITATLRLLFSDLFIHGTGGGRYDQFTTEFIREYWHEEASPIAVASASRFMFVDERQEISRLESVVSKLRDLQFNPQRYLSTGVFSVSLEAELKQLLSEKEDVVQLLKRARGAGESAEAEGRRIQALGDKIRQRVSGEFQPQVRAFERLPADAVDTIRSRTWPWFFFSH